MMEGSRLEEDKNIEENITKYVRIFFILKKKPKKKQIYHCQSFKKSFQVKKPDIKNLFEHGDIRNIFRFKKNNEVIKDRIF